MHRTFRSILTAAFLFACVWAAACPAALTPALAAPHPADNPAPVLTSITPTRTYVGDPAFTLTVTGSGMSNRLAFTIQPRPTVFLPLILR